MTYTTGTISYEHRTKAFWALAGLLIGLTLIQVYAVSATTYNVAERSVLEEKIQDLTAQQGNLEFAFIGLESNLDLETAIAQGYKEVRTPHFATRSTDGSLGFFTYNR